MMCGRGWWQHITNLGDKCYGSTTGSNPVSVGSTPTSLANFGGQLQCMQLKLHLIKENQMTSSL